MNKRQVKKQQKMIMKFVERAIASGVNIFKACKTREQGAVYECCMLFRNYKSNYGKLELKVFRQIQKNIVNIMIKDVTDRIKTV